MTAYFANEWGKKSALEAEFYLNPFLTVIQ